MHGGDNMLYALIDCAPTKGFNRISAEEILGEVKVIIPKFKEKNTRKIAKKVIKRISNYNVQNVVLGEKLENNAEFCKTLEENKKYIITGRNISKVVTFKIIDEICRYTSFPKEKMNVVLLMNEYSLENIELIELIASEVKQLNVVSRNYSKYEKAANRLFMQFGYVVKLFDSEKKNEFKRINIVVNLDFKEEAFENINFNKNSIIISLNEKISKIKNGFSGIIVNDIDIIGKEKSTINCRGIALCEAQIYRPLRNLKDNGRIFNLEKYIINGYIGKRGKITVEEFEKIGKNFT